MKTKPVLRPIFAVLMVLTMIGGLLPVSAWAYEPIDTTKSTSLTMKYQYKGVLLPKIPVQIYRVAEISDTAHFTLTGDFASYPVTIDGLTKASQWEAAAQTLANYAAADKITPTASEKSDLKGKIVFPELQIGLYLVVADQISIGNYKYTFSPSLISVPNLNEKDEWVYNVEAASKGTRTYNRDTPDTPDTPGGPGKTFLNYRVVKHWANSSNAQRPQEVTVQIYRNDTLYSTQILSANNNWTYKWASEDDGSIWKVVERKIEGHYTVTVTKDSTIFTVTNTYQPDKPEVPDIPEPQEVPDEPEIPDNPDVPQIPGEPEIPDNPDVPQIPDEPEIPDNPDVPQIPDEPEIPDNPDVPQTGQLWWPVSLLAGAGIILFGIGWFITNRRRKHEK